MTDLDGLRSAILAKLEEAGIHAVEASGDIEPLRVYIDGVFSLEATKAALDAVHDQTRGTR